MKNNARIRIAVLSFWHVHANDYSKEAAEHPDAEIVAVWDEEPGRGRAGAAQWGCPFEGNLPALLARGDIDAVIVVTPTNQHRDVMVAAARAGKHIFTEKVLAATLGEAEETFQLRSTKVPGADARWLTIADLPPALPSSFDQWIGHIKDGTTADENLRIALDLTLLMEAANESARTGRTVLLADS